DYLTHTMGKPDLIVTNQKQSDYIGKKGIIVVKVHGWSNARGHVTLWNGIIFSDQCHLLNDPDN
ncbi:T6SS effector amidase Tae4 family protein, partial [Salmonella enterica subsp. enterica serovar Infantis]